MPLTLDEIRRVGLKALRDRLGRAGMIQFLQQFETGSGNYSKSRHEWVDTMSMEELQSLVRARRARRKRR